MIGADDRQPQGLSGGVLEFAKNPNGAAVIAFVGVSASNSLREVIDFRDGDAGVAILARDNRGVWAGRKRRDNR